MAAPSQYGTDLLLGPGSTMGSYIVQEHVRLDKEGRVIRIDDENAAAVTLIVPDQYDRRRITLICKADALPANDFPIRGLCIGVGFTNWFVDAVEQTGDNSGGPNIVRVTLIQYGLT